MSRYITLLLIFSLAWFHSLGQSIVDIPSVGSITFPQHPESQETSGIKMFKFQDTRAIYVLLIKKMTWEESQFSNKDLDKFYKPYIKGVAEAAAATVQDERAFEISGLTGKDFTLVRPDSAAYPKVQYMRTLVVNDLIINAMFVPTDLDTESGAQQSKSYFSTLKITADLKTLKQGVDNPVDDSLAFKFGKALGLLILPGCVLGLLLLGRWYFKRRKRAGIIS